MYLTLTGGTHDVELFKWFEGLVMVYSCGCLISISGCTSTQTELNEILPATLPPSFLVERVVTGKVSDQDKVPVADASVNFVYVEDPEQTFGDTTAMDGSYSIRIAIPSSGGVSISAEDSKGTSRRFQLFQNDPNPFNLSTFIPYTLIEPGPVELSVHNVRGRRIITLIDSYQPAGDYSVPWDGRDELGHGVAAGIYLYRIQVRDQKATGKMTLVDGDVGKMSVAASGERVVIAEAVQFPHRFNVHIKSEGSARKTWRGVIIPEHGVLDFRVGRRKAGSPRPDTTRATNIGNLLLNLAGAIRDRDKALYASLLADDFWFIERDCAGSVEFENHLEYERLIIGELFDSFSDIQAPRLRIFDRGRIRRQDRYDYQAPDVPDLPHNPPDGEQWSWVYARFKVDLLNHLINDADETAKNYYVDQPTRIYMREDEDGFWRIVRWIADPIRWDNCLSAISPMKSNETEISWADAKRYLIPKQSIH